MTYTQRFWLCPVDFRRPIKKMRFFHRPMLPRLLPEKGKYKIHRGVKMKGTVTRDFKVLTEKISPENIAVMAELIAMRETKTLIGFMGYHAEIAHKKLCKDIFCKDMPGYVLSDSYDLVQSVALFLCGHCGKYLDDFLYISEKGKRRTIKFECYLIITRMLSKRYRLIQKYQSLEEVKEKGEISCMEETETEYQQEREDTLMEQMTAALNLTENMSFALDCRMSGMSYPEIAKRLSRAVSTVYEYFEKMRARYTAIYG